MFVTCSVIHGMDKKKNKPCMVLCRFRLIAGLGSGIRIVGFSSLAFLQGSKNLFSPKA